MGSSREVAGVSRAEQRSRGSSAEVVGVNEQAGVVGVIDRGGQQRSNRCHGGQQAKTYFNLFVSRDYFRYRKKNKNCGDHQLHYIAIFLSQDD